MTPPLPPQARPGSGDPAPGAPGGASPAADSRSTLVMGPASASAEGVPPEVAAAPPSAHFGRFVRVARLGSGGMGEVYKAWDPTLRRWVALKVLLRGAEAVMPWFQREARLAAQLHHPGLVAIHEVGEVEGRPFIAMQYVEGRTLDRIRGATREQLVSYVRDAAAAIGYAHEQGIVHRDLKPENLIVESRLLPASGAEPAWEHRVCVLDFGVARAMGSTVKLTAGWAAVGTPLYMSPEQACGEPPEPASDVYSLGATLYELLVGAPPIRGTSIQDTIRLIQKREPVPLRAIDSSVPSALAAVVHRCLAKDPRDRYPNGNALAEDLGRFLRGEPVEASERGRMWESWKWVQRRKVRVAVAVAMCAAVAASAYFTSAASARERAALDRLRRLDGLHAAVSRARGDSAVCWKSGDAAGARASLAQGDRACREELERGAFAEAHRLRAEVALDAGDPALAEQELTRALELDPGLPGARLLRGMARTARRDRLLRRELAGIGGARLSQGPVMPPTTEEMEFTFRELADLRRGALEDLAPDEQASRRLSPEQLALARACRSRLDADAPGAWAAVREAALQPRPSPDLLCFASVAALEAGDGAAALECSVRAVALWPGHPAARLARAHVAFACAGGDGTAGREQHLREATQEAETAQAMGAEMPDAALLRGSADLALREFARAETAFSSAVDLDRTCVAALLGRAEARTGLGRSAEASADFAEALKRLPENSCLRAVIETRLAPPPDGR